MIPQSKKEYIEAIFWGTKKRLAGKEPSSPTNSGRIADIIERTRFDYSEKVQGVRPQHETNQTLRKKVI